MPTVPHDIGPMGRIEGRIVGLHTMGNIAADVGALYAEKVIRKRLAAKDHNDQPVATTVGTEGGKAVKDISWMPRV